MIARILLASFGALAVTAVLLLGMDHVTSLFRERDNTRLFRIDDVIMKDRSRPERPEPVARQPETPRASFDSPDSRVPLELPDQDPPAAAVPLILSEPELAEPPGSTAAR